MKPFEFVILLISLIYTLALTHLLFASTRMIRHRRQLVLSWPHFFWMLAAFVLLADNWISLWDIRGEQTLPLAIIAENFLFAVVVYFQCALVSPDFEGGETYDMKHFHHCEGRTYIVAALVTVSSAILINLAMGSSLSISNQLNENKLVGAMLVPPIAALLVRRPWMQVIAPALLVVLSVTYVTIYYPFLTP